MIVPGTHDGVGACYPKIRACHIFGDENAYEAACSDSVSDRDSSDVVTLSP